MFIGSKPLEYVGLRKPLECFGLRKPLEYVCLRDNTYGYIGGLVILTLGAKTAAK